jgi:hypothetical protein
MSKLRDAIAQLASDLADGVIEAIRNISLEDLLAEAAGPGAARGRPRKASPERRAAAPSATSVDAGGSEDAPPRGSKAKRNKRLARRSAGDIAQVVERIVALLGQAQHAKGLRSEEIQAKLGLVAKELPRPIAEALASRRISKQGQKRATRYFAGKPSAPAKSEKSAKPAGTASPASPASAPKAGKAKSSKPAAKPAAKPGKLAPAAPKTGSKPGPKPSPKTAKKAKSGGAKSPANGSPAAASSAVSS